MINDHNIDGPAPVPGLGADSWAGLTDDAIAIRQRTAAGRDLAHHVDAQRRFEITEDDRETTPGLVPGRKQNRPTKVRQVSDRPARHVPGAGQPDQGDQTPDRPRLKARPTAGSTQASAHQSSGVTRWANPTRF